MTTPLVHASVSDDDRRVYQGGLLAYSRTPSSLSPWIQAYDLKSVRSMVFHLRYWTRLVWERIANEQLQRRHSTSGLSAAHTRASNQSLALGRRPKVCPSP
jgi:hypothetical protein